MSGDALETGSLDRTVADALMLIRHQPDNSDAWHTLGQCLLRHKLPQSARAVLMTAVQLDLQEKISGHIDPYFRQEMEITNIPDRLDLFLPLCQGRSVLHVGCCDYPLFNPKTNLHLRLRDHCSRLDGLDTDEAGLAELARLAPGNYFSSISQIRQHYDLLLVPETIEHVGNIGEFLTELASISFGQCLITAPNAFLPNDGGNYWVTSKSYVEFVHPDHICWFSPATLRTCIRKFTNWKIEGTYLLNDRRMVCCLCSSRSDLT